MNATVMSFNLRYNEPKDGDNAWPNRIHRAVAAIRENAPLVCGVQEALLPMLEDLQAELPEYAWIGEGRFGGPEGEHCAVLYLKERLEPVEHGQFWLSETPEAAASRSWDSSVARICTWVLFRDRESGKQFRLYNTHLDHRGPEARKEGARLILKALYDRRQRETDVQAVVTGDMNCFPQSDPIRMFRGESPYDGATLSDLQDVYTMAEQPVGKSFNGFVGLVDGEPIDYIFVTPGVEIVRATLDRAQYDGGYPSDHYPLVAELIL